MRLGRRYFAACFAIQGFDGPLDGPFGRAGIVLFHLDFSHAGERRVDGQRRIDQDRFGVGRLAGERSAAHDGFDARCKRGRRDRVALAGRLAGNGVAAREGVGFDRPFRFDGRFRLFGSRRLVVSPGVGVTRNGHAAGFSGLGDNVFDRWGLGRFRLGFRCSRHFLGSIGDRLKSGIGNGLVGTQIRCVILKRWCVSLFGL